MQLVLTDRPLPARPVVSVAVNCGFLEPSQNDLAVEMVRLFCRRSGYPFGSAWPFRRARRRGFHIPRFARNGQSSLIPSLLLSNANPLCWALRWGRLRRLFGSVKFDPAAVPLPRLAFLSQRSRCK